LNINSKKFPQIKNENFIKNTQKDEVLPPKPKEKWKYIKKLKNL